MSRSTSSTRASRPETAPVAETTGAVHAVLAPTNTGKTHRAIERMLEHQTGMIGLPLRLLAREVYDRISAVRGESQVALITGEEKRVPAAPRYWVCTVESMPLSRPVDFVAIDEIQLAAHHQRGHIFTARLLEMRGRRETWFMGAETMRELIATLVPEAAVARHPRLSQLRYAGTSSLRSLPPRSAVVAFSATKVYELAERLRQHRGGVAVVLGALSPRTRNAQVALYQSGEVQYMVATDAIGMGLNMDVDHIAFAALHKFDGQQDRPLEISEMAQIAGRAGRYQSDGTFGTLAPLPDLPWAVVRAIETHRFRPIERLMWRNSQLDMRSIDTLIASLARRPGHSALRLTSASEDFSALIRLAADPDIRQRAQGTAAVSLLWDVCRIPDFRKLLEDSHVNLLRAIYTQLTDPGERIAPDWMNRRVSQLDDVSGDIDTLMQRIAFVRTWTYL
ncbi:MAG: helicase-related protein, partial [Myxococcota bacterium]